LYLISSASTINDIYLSAARNMADLHFIFSVIQLIVANGVSPQATGEALQREKKVPRYCEWVFITDNSAFDRRIDPDIRNSLIGQAILKVGLFKLTQNRLTCFARQQFQESY
jgi:hypothetical protein